MGAPETVLSEYAALRKMIDAYTPVSRLRDGHSPAQIYSGEWGYPASRGAGLPGLDLLTQAKYLTRMWLTNSVAGIAVSIWYQYLDPPSWTGLPAHGTVYFDDSHDGCASHTTSDNATSCCPHTPKPAFLAAEVLQRSLGALPCTGRVAATSRTFYGGLWRADPQAFAVGYGSSAAAADTTAFAVWLTDVMPDDGLRCEDIHDRRQAAAYNTRELCEEGSCCWNASVKLPPYNLSCWLRNRAGTSVGHPLPALVTFPLPQSNVSARHGQRCYRCVSMTGEEGCPTTTSNTTGELRKTVCGGQDGQLSVVASDAPLYLLPP